MTGEVQKTGMLRSDIIKLLSQQTGISEEKIRSLNSAQLAKLISSSNIPAVDPSQLPKDSSAEKANASVQKESWFQRTMHKIPKGVRYAAAGALVVGAGALVVSTGGLAASALPKIGLAVAGLLGASAIFQSCKPETYIPIKVPNNYYGFFHAYYHNEPMYSRLQWTFENEGSVTELKQIFNDNDMQLDSVIKHKNELKDMIHKIEAKASGTLNNEQQQLLAQMLATTVLIDESNNDNIDKLKEFLEMVYNKFDSLNPADTKTYNSILKSLSDGCNDNLSTIKPELIDGLMTLADMDNSSAYMAVMAVDPYKMNLLNLFLSVPSHSDEWKTVFNGLVTNAADMALVPKINFSSIIGNTAYMPENMQLDIYNILGNTAPVDLPYLDAMLRLGNIENTFQKQQMESIIDSIVNQPMTGQVDVNTILNQISNSELNNKEQATANGIMLVQVLNNMNSIDNLRDVLITFAQKAYTNVQNCGSVGFPSGDSGYISAQDLCAKLQRIIDGDTPYDKSTFNEIFFGFQAAILGML